METFFEQMMKFSLNVMVSGMETMAESMEEVRQKSEIPGEAENASGADDGYASAMDSVSRLAIVPFIEISKLPFTVFVKTISGATQEFQEQAAAAAGVFTEEEEQTVEEFDREIIPLNPQEAEQEAAAALTLDEEDKYQTTLWQIGRSGRKDFQGKWTSAFDYHLGTDIDEVNSPTIPHFISVPSGPKTIGTTERLNIHFTLERDYKSGELAFIYDRWGGEKDQIYIDDELLAPVSGAGRGMFKHVALSLKDISTGDHVISITTSGETEGHRVDYVKLIGIETSA